ncbi:MAG: DUF4363 family protein [Bacillota bacterium]
MRLLAALIILFAVIVTAGFWMNHQLEVSTAQLLANIDKIEDEIRVNNWEKAYRQTTGLEKTWRKEAGWWPMVLDHQEMDNIEFALARFKEYVYAQNPVLSRAQLSELRLMIRHIPEKEALSIQNIL